MANLTIDSVLWRSPPPMPWLECGPGVAYWRESHCPGPPRGSNVDQQSINREFEGGVPKW